MIVYISIGNSDDKLTQAEWHNYVIAMLARIKPLAVRAHGEWFSDPMAAWQNACWCLEFTPGSAELSEAREVCTEIRKEFRQDSIAWAVVPETEFI
jgi:hypothetical protein